MLTPSVLYPFQLFLLITNGIAASVLEAIIDRDSITRTWYVSCTMFIIYYYALWGIILISTTFAFEFSRETRYQYKLRLTLHVLNTLYDIGILVFVINGFATVIPDTIQYEANRKTSTALIAATIVYQLIVMSHSMFNIRYVLDYGRLPPNDDIPIHTPTQRIHPFPIYPIIRPAFHNILHVVHIERKSEIHCPNDPPFCCICMSEHTHVTILPCKHREFCLKCVERIVELVCPLCRTPFSTVESERVVASKDERADDSPV